MPPRDNPDRPTVPPRVDGRSIFHRTNPRQVSDKLNGGAVDRDELALQVMREMEERHERRIEEIRNEFDTKLRRSDRPSNKAGLFQQLPAIIIAISGLIAALAAFRKEPDTTKDREGYEALSKAAVTNAEADAARAKIEDERWKFTIGLFKRIPGIVIVETPGQEPIEPIEILPPPRVSKPPPAPTIQVRTPLPDAAPPPRAVVPLPSPEKLFGAKPEK